MRSTRTSAGGTGKATRAVANLTAATLLDLAVLATNPAAAASCSVTVSAFVQARAKVTVEAQPNSFVVSETYVRRGYVDLPGASRIRVRTNSAAGYLLAFAIDSECVTGVVLRGAGDQIRISGSGGLVPRPYSGPVAVVADLAYRFLLSPDAKPGD